ncbi:MAG: DNA repair protein RecO [Coriobacteriales bacterium]|jgi:DNA repair protein RecO (recombination protein O)|nr:DNA repair protein RecO [Coriobacteriales bacterium]
MADYSAQALVLKKTRLREKDLIITLLSAEGHQIRAVAKGARRPGSRATAAVELFCVSDFLLSRGRSLDVVCEAQISCANAGCRADVEHSTAASVVGELVEKLTRDAGTEKRLFALSSAALAALGTSATEALPLLVAATILKIAAQTGIKPALDQCAVCGTPLSVAAAAGFSVKQGGLLCERCAARGPASGDAAQAAPSAARRPVGVATSGFTSDAATLNPQLLGWLRALLFARYNEIAASSDEIRPSRESQMALLDIALAWLEAHLGLRLVSARLLRDLFAA